jgi:hypothetical protein
MNAPINKTVVTGTDGKERQLMLYKDGHINYTVWVDGKPKGRVFSFTPSKKIPNWLKQEDLKELVK